MKSDARRIISISTRLVTLSPLFKNFRLEIIYSFLIMLIKLIIEQRRNFVVDRRYKYAFLIMRSCRVYVAFDVSYQVNKEYLKCKKCYRKNWKCDLTLDYQEMNKIIQKTKKLNDKITKLRLRIARKTKQRKH